MSSSAAPVIRRAVGKAAQKKEDVLRNAIALYHLSPSFYPTSAKSTEGGESSSSTLDKQIDKTIRKDLFGSRSERPGDVGFKLTQPPNFATADTLIARVEDVVSRGPSDGNNSHSVFAQTEINHSANEPFLDSQQKDEPLEQARLAQIRKAFISSGEAAMRSTKSSLRPGLTEDAPTQHHIQLQGSAAVRQGLVDERTARIRDALFGTVGAGEKPGLDAIRARKRNSTAA